MKIKIRPEHASMLQMNDWLAELRDGESAEPAGPDDAEPTGPGHAEPTGPGPSGPGYAVPDSYSYAVPTSPSHGEPAGYVRAVPPPRPRRATCRQGPARSPRRTRCPSRPGRDRCPRQVAVPTRPAAPTAPAGRAGAAARAVIGDQLRMPIMWCEMGSCISWHADPAALGEADTRARAIAAGWRIDALGRLACPRCQQDDPRYWAARPVVPRDRYTANAARTARIPAAPRSSRDHGRAASGYPPPSRAELDWHHDSPADEAMPAGRYAGNPAGTSHSRGRSSIRSEPGELAAAARRHLAKPGGHGEDLMIAERAHANPAGATTLTGRRW